MQIYITDINGGDNPRQLTHGKQGATHNPVFNAQGDKVAWLELDLDGYEADRYARSLIISHLSLRLLHNVTNVVQRSLSTT